MPKSRIHAGGRRLLVAAALAAGALLGAAGAAEASPFAPAPAVAGTADAGLVQVRWHRHYGYGWRRPHWRRHYGWRPHYWRRHHWHRRHWRY
jgi:hypothetical protein